MSTFKWVMTAALAMTAGLGAGAVQARDADVQWSVTIGSPGYPVYTQPYPVYRQPAPVVVMPSPRYSRYGGQTRWDRDGDGIPNHRDRLYNPAWDRDGDGVPNRYDRNDRYDDRRDRRDRYDEGCRR